jgi:hypothetical protein
LITLLYPLGHRDIVTVDVFQYYYAQTILFADIQNALKRFARSSDVYPKRFANPNDVCPETTIFMYTICKLMFQTI